MSTVQRVAKNTGIVIVGNVIFRIISLFVIIGLARYLGAVEFGKYSFVFAYLGFFGVIADLGLQQILVREMARDPAITQKLIGNTYIIRGILALISVVSSVVMITLMSYPADTTTYVYIAAFTLVFISFSDFYATLFQANLRMEYNIIAKLVYKFLSAGLIFWIIFAHGSLMLIMITLVFSEMVRTMLSYWFSRKFVRPRFVIDSGLCKYLLKAAFPLALTSVIWIIYFRIDIIMLSVMQGDASVGIYSAASKLCDPFSLIPYAFMMSLFPIMSASFKSSNKDKIIKTYRLGFKYILIITLPIAIGITIVADEIILLIYGTEFVGSITALQILIWTLVFASTNYLLANLLISTDKQKLDMVSSGLCAIVNIALNLILIPMLNYNGAAIATVATTAVLFLSNFYFVSKHLQLLPIHKLVIKPVISGLTMAIFMCFFININVFLLTPMAGMIYIIALLVLKTFSEEDWNMIKKVLKL